MPQDRTTTSATLVVVATGVLWGFYWIPVRALAKLDLDGAWGAALIVAVATLALSPFALAGWRRLAAAPATVASVAVGGVAFVLYSAGLVYGRVAIVILMFFLTPVWSTLIGRLVMGWPTPRLRYAAIAVGLAGLGVMLGAGGSMPVPRGAGEWLSLISGISWSVATTGMRSNAALRPGEASFVFAAGACAGALALAPVLAPVPDGLIRPWDIAGWAAAAGLLWWGASMIGLMWAAPRLDPARVGILLMSEVLVGAVSAAAMAGELLSPAEIAGGALVLSAGVLELWPVRGRARQATPPSRVSSWRRGCATRPR